MANRIQLFRTTSSNPPPANLSPGEMSVCIPVGNTKLYLGDGSANRLLLSTNPADNPVMTASYLSKAGGAMSGALTLSGVAPGPNDAVSKTYVDAAVAGLRQFAGTWWVRANLPDLREVAPAGTYYLVQTDTQEEPEIAPRDIPGIGDQAFFGGGYVVSNGTIWQHLLGGSLTRSEADTYYIPIAGGTLSGPLILSEDPTLPLQAATKQYVDATLGAYLPLTGGVLSGPLTLSADPSEPQHAATKQYVDALEARILEGIQRIANEFRADDAEREIALDEEPEDNQEEPEHGA